MLPKFLVLAHFFLPSVLTSRYTEHLTFNIALSPKMIKRMCRSVGNAVDEKHELHARLRISEVSQSVFNANPYSREREQTAYLYPTLFVRERCLDGRTDPNGAENEEGISRTRISRPRNRRRERRRGMMTRGKSGGGGVGKAKKVRVAK